MKILFCQIIRNLSGSEKYFIEIMPMLKARGIDCEFLCVHFPKDGDNYLSIVNPLEASGVKVHCIATKNALNWQLLKAMAVIIKNGQFDLIHSHLIHADIWMVLVKGLFNIKTKIVSTKHGFNDTFTAKYGFNPQKKMYNAHYLASLFAEKFIFKSFAVSEGVRKYFIGSKISKAQNIETIHLGFEMKTQFANVPKPNNKTHLEIVIIGRLVPYKGHEFVLKAMPKVIEKFPNVQLKIVGKGTSETYLKALTEELNITKNVDFLGYSSEVMKIVHQADVMLIPSKSEGFGIVFLEAFEAKTPVIAFDVPACNEIIESGKDGYLVKPFDTEELAEKMITLLENPTKRTQFAEAAFEKLNTVFTPEKMVNKTLAFYRKVMNEK